MNRSCGQCTLIKPGLTACLVCGAAAPPLPPVQKPVPTVTDTEAKKKSPDDSKVKTSTGTLVPESVVSSELLPWCHRIISLTSHSVNQLSSLLPLTSRTSTAGNDSEWKWLLGEFGMDDNKSLLTHIIHIICDRLDNIPKHSHKQVTFSLQTIHTP
jgi:hypothetical protein